MSGVQAQSIQNTFYVDETKNWFVPEFPRGPRVKSAEYVCVPVTGIDPTHGIGGQTLEFRLPRDKGQFIENVWFSFEMELNAAFCSTLYTPQPTSFTSGSKQGDYNMTFIDYPALHAIKKASLEFGGDTVEELFGGDHLRDLIHFYKSDTDKLLHWQLASGNYKGWNSTFTPKTIFDHGRDPLLAQPGTSSMIGIAFDSRASPFTVRSPLYPNDADAAYNFQNVNQATVLPPNGWHNPYHDTLGNAAIGRDAGINTRYALHQNIGAHGDQNLIGPTQASEGFRVRFSVEFPFSNMISLDRALPVGLLDQDVIMRIDMHQPGRLIQRLGYQGSAQVAKLAGHVDNDMYFKNPSLRITYKEQAAPTFATLARQPSITFPQSKYIMDRIFLPRGSGQQIELPIQNIRGLVHTICFKIRPVGAVDGQVDFAYRGGVTPNIHTVKLYDPEFIDMNLQDSDRDTRTPGSQRQLESFDILVNGLSIIGKDPQNARHNLVAYKPCKFKVGSELERPYAFKVDGTVAPFYRGRNVYAHCFGVDGDRGAAGTGVINWDALGPKRLLLNFRTPGVDGFKLADFDQYVDVIAFTAGVTVLEKGIWYRDLSA